MEPDLHCLELTIHRQMIQTMEDIIRRFCAYGMEYKDNEGYTHEWVTFLPEIQLYYNTGQKEIRDSFLGPFNIIRLIGNNAVKVRLTEEFSRKHPVLPVSLVKLYHQTGEDKLPYRNKSHTPHKIVEVEDSPGPVKKIMKARGIRLNRKGHSQYLVRFKNQTADRDKWLAGDAIPD
ncbi:hypothetical protein O181_039604 [Austropuccinia psidii MF-1]|uniref:Uncharacterized protein n=1 Tax=Austropuccinia psidii MF-1 TaxID=1389203 RepID=A0A9Q3DAS5_9BASI|nr:hypothetical protein [Austropuccinia psidii MF-1]